jgi:hypothetical protein
VGLNPTECWLLTRFESKVVVKLILDGCNVRHP